MAKQYTVSDWGILWMFAIVSILIPQIAFALGLKLLDASTVGIVSIMEPVIAIVAAFFILGESLGVIQIFGGLMVLASSGIAAGASDDYEKNDEGRMRTERRLNRLEEVLRHRQPDLTVVMENIHDPHNVSAILRSCDAAGVMEVQLIYTDTEFPDIGKKSSASAKKWVERRRFKSVKECYDKLHEEGYDNFCNAFGRSGEVAVPC